MPEYLLYLGTYSVRGSKGIYVYRFDSASGDLRLFGLAAESTHPSFLAVDKEQSLIYAVVETNDSMHGQTSGAVRAYSAVLKTGLLTLLNEVSSMGVGPCYLAFDRTGRYLLTANYHSGSIAIFPRLEDGRLGKASAFVQHHGSNPHSIRQRGPHPHAIATSPDNRVVLVADLGLDKLLLYRFDAATGSISEGEPTFVKVNDGAGPRHFAFHTNGRFIYLVNELDSTVTLLTFDVDTASMHTVKTISCLPEGFGGQNYAAHLQVDARGRFLYISNRGLDSIAVFSIDQTQGTLDIVEHVPSQGKTPRGFVLDPSGKWLLVGNEDSDNIKIFRISEQTGKLTLTHQTLESPSPAFLIFP
jgi:6-phosphogluconolactonase